MSLIERLKARQAADQELVHRVAQHLAAELDDSPQAVLEFAGSFRAKDGCDVPGLSDAFAYTGQWLAAVRKKLIAAGQQTGTISVENGGATIILVKKDGSRLPL